MQLFEEYISPTFYFPPFQDTFEIQKDAVQKGQKVVIVDDLIATGGRYHNRYQDNIPPDNIPLEKNPPLVKKKLY